MKIAIPIICLLIAGFLGLYLGRTLNCNCLNPIANQIELSEPCYCDTTQMVRATTYNTEIAQTDSTPNKTADGSYIDSIKLFNQEIKWVALSRDLIWDDYRQTIFSDTTLWRGRYKFGDTVSLYSNKFPNLDGDYILHDCMHDTCRMSIDFLMDPRNNKPKLGVGRDIKLIWCGED